MRNYLNWNDEPLDIKSIKVKTIRSLFDYKFNDKGKNIIIDEKFYKKGEFPRSSVCAYDIDCYENCIGGTNKLCLRGLLENHNDYRYFDKNFIIRV